MITPRHEIPRDPAARSDGILARRFAIARGRPLIAWQADAADRIGQRLPDPSVSSGWRYRYPVCLIGVPRQCGKTSLAFDIALGRGLAEPDYRAAFTAQTGTVVTDRFGEQRGEIAGSRLAPFYTLRASAGTERISNQRTGSYVKAFPPKDGALRGSALDLVIVDEAQEHSADLGAALDATITPTFSTRPRRQLLIFYTAGTDRSGYLRRYRDMALAGEPGIALLEYGAGADDDPLDPATWAACHPGIAGGLTDLEALRSALTSLGPAGFAREYLNVWTAGAAWIIDPETLAAATDPDLTPPAAGMILGVDSSPDRRHAAVSGSWRDPAGRLCLALLWTGTGDRLRAAADDLAARLGARVAFDHYSAGPSAANAPGWTPIMARDLSAASALLLDAAGSAGLRLAPDPEMSASILAAATRPVGAGGGFTFTRRGGESGADLSPLMSAVIATAGLLAVREPLLVI